jgi:glycosyltransferase involved in cell wall biosynthesis
MAVLISIIIPAYNEDTNIEILISRLFNCLQQTEFIYEIIVINDGSSDKTQDLLEEISVLYSNVYFINLSRNFGQQNALRAGYEHASGKAVICMDADLQNPPEIIISMLEKWQQGYEVVICKRKNAVQHGGFIKGISSKMFYRILSAISDIPIEQHSPDFRLIDRQLVDLIKQMPEKDIFFRGMISWMGFKRAVIEYNHGLRIHGETQYSIPKMIKLAGSGLTSFSVRPLHLAIYLGVFISGLSLLYIPYVLYQFYNGHTISGWSSLIIAVSFLGGLQLLIIGILGLYLGKLFIQSKGRPNYIIKNTNIKSSHSLEFGIKQTV